MPLKILTWAENDEDEERTFDVLITVKDLEVLHRRREALEQAYDELSPKELKIRVSRVRCPDLHPVLDGVDYRLVWAIPQGHNPPVKWRVVKSLTTDIDIYLTSWGIDLHYVDMDRFQEWEAHVGWDLLTGELEKSVYRMDVS